jgi:hypothetical protein
VYAESAERTLLEDWQARRERLAGGPAPVGQFGEVHIQILDYLIGRYGDSPEAARPARVGPTSEVHVDDRVIVVHHHLWQGKVAGVKSRREAELRMAEILGRMATPDEDQAAEREDEESAAGDPLAFHGFPMNDLTWRAALGTANWSIRFGRDPAPHIAVLLERSRFLPIEIVRYLYERLRNVELEDANAAGLLLECENRGAPKYAVLAWRERLAAGRRDAVTERLQWLFCLPQLAQRVLDPIRAELANDSPLVRLGAIDVLGEIGTLEDIGLLSDLLCLPPLEDEHPEERPALAQAMQKIARADSDQTTTQGDDDATSQAVQGPGE